MIDTPTLRRGTTDVVMRRLFPKADPFVEDPNGWAKARGIHLWSGQRTINESVVENRYTAVRSCHGIGKSFDAALLVNWWLSVHPPGEAFVVTTAPTDKQVKAILWRYIRRMHNAFGLAGRTTLDADYYLNIAGEDELVAYGRKPADYDPAAFQGIHARYVLVILDEACGVPKLLYDAVDSLVTSPGSRVLAIGNPDDPNSHFAKVCAPGSHWTRHKISAWDSPAFTGEPVPERLAEELVTRQWVEERERDWGKTSPLFIAKVDAEFPDVSEDSLISMSDVMAATRRDLPGLGPGRYGVDVARFGDAESVIYRNRDGVIRLVWSGAKASTMVTAGNVKRLLDEKPNQRSSAVIDADGVGGGVYDRLKEQDVSVTSFHGGRRASLPDQFGNLRSELYWDLRRAFEQGEIDLDADDEELQAQLTNIKFRVDSRGKIWIETKDEMRKRGVSSPDRADAVMMSTYAGTGIEAFVETVQRLKERERAPRTLEERMVEDIPTDVMRRPL